MTRVRLAMTMSLDGFVAGPRQSLEHPLGEGAEHLHDWAFATRSFRAMHGMDGGEGGLDDDHAMAWAAGVGATVMGRNMFGPVRGAWGDLSAPDAWRGWWGDDPPFHHPVFVLTHHPRPSLAMEGGTTFHFVTDGLENAVERAHEAAGGLDVAIGGGASTARQALAAGLVDDLALHVVPQLLGEGERLLEGLRRVGESYAVVEHVASAAVLHVTFARRS